MPERIFHPIFYARSLMEAELVKGLLRGEGIDARIPDALSMDPYVTAQETAGDIRIEVPRDRFVDARRVLQEAMDEGRQLSGWLASHPDEAPPGKRP